MCQPQNSPDLNVLDLGFFSGIQLLMQKKSPRNIDELIFYVKQSFDEFDSKKSNLIFLMLQLCMIETMKVQGSNHYKIPHAQKARLERMGQLPCRMKCDTALVQDVLG